MKSFYFSACFALAFLLMQCHEPAQPVTNPYKWTSGVTTISTDSQTVENLVVLGRIWGFLKYYHPRVAVGMYNWDYELFKIMPKIISAKNANERNEKLACWIDSLAAYEQQDSANVIDSSMIAHRPDYSWINQKSLGKSLTAKLNSIITAKRSGKSTYVQFTVVNSPTFRDESLYDSLQFPDAGYRLLCLFRYWNIVEYYYPYKHLIGHSWDTVLRNYIPKFVSCKNELDYEICVTRMAAEIHDSHATISGDINAFVDYRGHFSPLVRLSFIEGAAVVIGFCDSETEKSCGLKRGDVILSVDGITVDSLYRERKDNIRSSNQATALRDFCTSILRSKDSLVHIEYERKGIVYAGDILCYDSVPTVDFHSYYGVDSAIYMISNDIACVFPGLITTDALSSALPKLEDTKGIIVDLRCYPKNIIVEPFCNFLFSESTAVAKYTHASNFTPGLFTYSNNEFQGRVNPKCYKGKVVILTNEETQSEAEHHVMAFQKAPNAIVIGSATAGADGNMSEICLPGGIRTMFSGIGVLYPDGREVQRTGIIPDVEAHPTIKGIREGRDEVMEAAIAYINR